MTFTGLYCFNLPMESARNNQIQDSNMQANIHGNPEFRPGKIGNALNLDGRKDYVEAGDHSNGCLGDLSLCHYGITVSMWLKFGELSENAYYLSTGSQGVELYYRNGKLTAEAQEGKKNWRTSWDFPDTAVWYFIEFTWDSPKGLKMYVNLELVDEEKEYSIRDPQSGNGGTLYLGRANTEMRSERYPNVAIDQVDICFGERDALVETGFIERGTNLEIIQFPV